MEIKINLYEIQSCGYYVRNSTYSRFGAFEEVLDDIHGWISNVQPTIKETQTFSTTEDSSNLPAYCFDIQKNSVGDYLITIWNENQTLDGKFASIQGSDTVGEAKADTVDKPEGGISGFPTYFFIVPKSNLLCSIRFDGATTGIRNFNRFMKGYLERFSKWTVLENPENDKLTSGISGYRANKSEEALNSYFVRFLAKPCRKDGDIAKIRKNRASIRKVIRKDVYDTSVKEKKQYITAFLGLLGTSGLNSIQQSAEYKAEVEYNPTVEELNAIIKNWESEESHTGWDDVGFCFKGDSQVYWMGSMLKKDELEIDRPTSVNSVYVAKSLLEKVLKKKEYILKKFNE